MPRIRLFLASLLLIAPAPAAWAQNSQGNFVTPAPPPREGTVGPEQLRDFSLPGTRPAPAEPAEAAPVPDPAPSTARPAAQGNAAVAPPRADREQPASETATSTARPPAAIAQGSSISPNVPPPADQVTLALPDPGFTPSGDAAAALPALPPPGPSMTPPETGSPLLWPWLLAAGLALAALLFFVWQRSQRRRPAYAGMIDMEPAAASPPPPAPVPPPPMPPRPQVPPPAQPDPPLPKGMVTTRLRSAAAMARPDPVPQPAAPTPVGAVVSTGLRPWIDLDCQVIELAVDEREALIRFKIALTNSGMATARDILVEALPINAGDDQGAQLAAFFNRAPGEQAGLPALERLETTELTHEVRMPRDAIRAYQVDGQMVFVPVLAFAARYRWHTGQGTSGAAFLLGQGRAGAERLAPLRLRDQPFRLSTVGTKRLAESLRR